MPETAPNGGVRANTSAGHISVHVEGDHPVEVPFLFEQQEKRLGPAFVASFVYHLAMFGIHLLTQPRRLVAQRRGSEFGVGVLERFAPVDGQPGLSVRIA